MPSTECPATAAGAPLGTLEVDRKAGANTMVVGNYRDLFATIAGASATLTGLLFVAVSVTVTARRASFHEEVVQQIRAAASLLAFTSALAISLFGIVPNTNVGYPAVVLGVTGVFFTAASLRSIVASTSARDQIRRQLGLVIFLLIVFGFELLAGIRLLVHSHNNGALGMLSYVLVASLLIGIARAWELVGDRDTGLFASIAILSGHLPTQPPSIPDEPPS